MALHRTERKLLKDAPLVLVLSEVKFSPVLSMASKVADVQELLRVQGFPKFTRAMVHQFEFSAEGSKVIQSDRWVFANRAETRFIVLTNSSIAYEVTDYKSFEDFVDTLKPALVAFAQIVGQVITERVGLRFINLIEPEPGKALNFYLRPPVLSFQPEQLGAEKLIYGFQVTGPTDVGQIAVRLSEIENAASIPPDLVSPELGRLAVARPGLTTILDIDCGASSGDDFSTDSAIEQLWSVHDGTQRAFWASVTGEALTAWGATDQHVGGSLP